MVNMVNGSTITIPGNGDFKIEAPAAIGNIEYNHSALTLPNVSESAAIIARVSLPVCIKHSEAYDYLYESCFNAKYIRATQSINNLPSAFKLCEMNYPTISAGVNGQQCINPNTNGPHFTGRRMRYGASGVNWVYHILDGDYVNGQSSYTCGFVNYTAADTLMTSGLYRKMTNGVISEITLPFDQDTEITAD